MDAVLESIERSDEQLLAEAAREGSDGPAFVELVNRHRQRVWRICYRLLGNEHDAQDAAQEVFVALFLQRRKFAGRARFTTWLHGIAVRKCLMLRRGRGRRQRRENPADAGTLDIRHSSRAPHPDTSDVYEMLGILDDEDRALMLLKYAEDYTIEELAEIFELSPSACKMRLSRAREKLQAQFGRDFGPDEPDDSRV
ncbi:MAG: RNA polymerase sigma factor [Pirellulales bacterium]|nr:RNA polymerase sigma factor [Pirellulales bacterium]